MLDFICCVYFGHSVFPAVTFEYRDNQFHFTFLEIVYFGVAYGNRFTTNMRSACACGQVTERLTFLFLELRFPKLDPASFEGYSKKTTLL